MIESTFGVLKARFLILKKSPPYPFPTQVKLVVACHSIHNHIRSENKNDWIFDLELGNEASQQMEEANQVEGEFENISYGRQRKIASQLRCTIANQMWEDQSQS